MAMAMKKRASNGVIAGAAKQSGLPETARRQPIRIATTAAPSRNDGFAWQHESAETARL
jgi:hypothetical protein